ncbi:MAG TPA: NAD(P)/FAD-dependent oxidoreductase, partial [Acidimicrobiia bacterium]|nr:NAD(P)/FAD-dependent oxidoreductase [Acidimicrobiia bacterium]
MAVRLKRDGEDDFVVVERAGEVGGTWRDNTYPGAACDVPSNLYSFSFAPNPDWSRSFSPQAEIQAYLERVATDFGLRPHIRFHHEVQQARWDGAAGLWRVRTSGGVFDADVLISATGALSDPAIPPLPGLDRFAGTVFHSARWNHDHDLSGERVAVVGTGASAIQFVPRIQPRVGHLTVFQRTPPWILPRWDRPFRPSERWAFRHLPVVQRLARAGIYWGREQMVAGFVVAPKLMKLAERLARRHLAEAVADPALRARLTPDYRIGCKRILISNDYLPALAQPNVDLVAAGVVEVREHSVVAADGTEHPVDTIIFGTGFRVTDIPVADRIVGRGGITLKDRWSPGMRAYKGSAVAGFPNLFLLVGPNTGLGHSSQVFMIESQIAYVLDAVRHIGRTGAPLEVREDAEAGWDAGVQRAMARTVWTTGGCASWYLDATGRNTTLWPGSTWRFRRR